MKMLTVARHTALGLALLYAAAPLVRAQQVQVATGTTGPIQFMNGGIGKSEQTSMREAGKAYRLRVELSERADNEFIADADLQITDMQGRPVFALPEAGPIVNVDLPQGEYRVAATFDGQTESRLITLRGRQREDVYFHWKGKPKVEPVASSATDDTTDDTSATAQ
jgi:hypothetical protein